MEKTAGNVQEQIIPWILAARPKTLSASLGPVLVGSMLAPKLDIFIAISVLLTAVLIQIGTNLVNDALDFKKGADTAERLGPKRVTAGGMLTMQQVLLGAWSAFGLSILSGIPLVIIGGLPILLLILSCCILGYLYTGGPYPMAYHGLGEIFSFLFFGVVLTTVSFYLQAGYWTNAVIIAGIQLGMLSTVLLAINNLRDIAEDSRTNKRTLAMRFGKTFGRIEISILALAPFIISFYGETRLVWFALPVALLIVTKIWKTEPGSSYNKYLAMGGLLQLLFGVLLSIGVWLK